VISVSLKMAHSSHGQETVTCHWSSDQERSVTIPCWGPWYFV